MPSPNHDNEQFLVKDLREGSLAAFEQIFKLYWQRLYVLAKSKVHSHDEAEEIIQAIFSNLWEKRQTLLITNLSFYLHTAVRNSVINIIRSKITQEKYWDYYKSFIPVQQHATEHAIEYDDLNHAVEKAVSSLPEKSRTVFKLSRLEGRSNAEIANHLKVSEKAIQYHLTKSLRQLRLHLKDFIF
jgi:RNA polymerase sigma-70 factor (ECF subfamily)